MYQEFIGQEGPILAEMTQEQFAAWLREWIKGLDLDDLVEVILAAL